MTNRVVEIAAVPMVPLFPAPLLACGGKLNGVVDFDHQRNFLAVQKLGFDEDVKPLERAQTKTREKVRAEVTRPTRLLPTNQGEQRQAE